MTVCVDLDFFKGVAITRFIIIVDVRAIVLVAMYFQCVQSTHADVCICEACQYYISCTHV